MDLARSPLRANWEVKARIDRYEDAVETARRCGAVDRGTVEQTDTFFSMGAYRLKLRESSDGEHWLIGYSRPARPEARRSQYRLEPVHDPASLREALSSRMGVKAVVRKARRLFLWNDRVRIHVDRVEGLGEFVEFEAVLGAAPGYDEDAARLDLARLSHDFGIEPRDLVAESYADLLGRAETTPAGT